jgi:hypothetical protein
MGSPHGRGGHGGERSHVSLFSDLRILAFLRRIARAAESIAESQSTLARIASSEWAKRNPVRRKAPVELSTMDVPAIESAWREEQEALREMEESGR